MFFLSELCLLPTPRFLLLYCVTCFYPQKETEILLYYASYVLCWQMVKIRDPEQQLEMVGVPEEHIQGHAFHLYHLTSPDDRK